MRMMGKRSGALAAAAALALACLAGCDQEVTAGSSVPSAAGGTTEAALTGKLVMAGSTSMEKVCGALNEAFRVRHPELTIELQASGSGAAITALKEGTAQIGNLSREVKEAENADGQFEAVTIALDGIAVIVHPDNPIKDLSLADLAAIFKGDKTSWTDFGGTDGAIHAVGREEGSGTRDGFESVVGVEDACRYGSIANSTGNVVTKVASDPQAIGYVSFAAVGEGVKAVLVDGVAPSEGTIADKSYTLQRPFVHAYKKGTTDPNVLAYLAYLKTDEAQNLIKAQDLVPQKFW